VIASYWNILETYCPDCSTEYTPSNATLLEEQQKEMYDLVQETIPSVMVAPSEEMMQSLAEAI